MNFESTYVIERCDRVYEIDLLAERDRSGELDQKPCLADGALSLLEVRLPDAGKFSNIGVRVLNFIFENTLSIEIN